MMGGDDEQKRLKEQACQDKREWRKLLKQNHLCIDCKKQDAYTLNGRSRCYECAKKNAKASREYRSKKRNKHNKAQKELHAKWREEGRCVRCGRVKPWWELHALCEQCRIQMAGLKRSKREACDDYFPRGTPGLCYFCLQPVLPGKKVCKRCYDARIASMAKAREAAQANKSSHVWMIYNNADIRKTQRRKKEK